MLKGQRGHRRLRFCRDDPARLVLLKENGIEIVGKAPDEMQIQALSTVRDVYNKQPARIVDIVEFWDGPDQFDVISTGERVIQVSRNGGVTLDQSKAYIEDLLSRISKDAPIRPVLKEHLKKTAEIANSIFVDEKDLKGVIIGGPGPIKERFKDGEYLDYRLRKKILDTVSLSKICHPWQFCCIYLCISINHIHVIYRNSIAVNILHERWTGSLRKRGNCRF